MRLDLVPVLHVDEVWLQVSDGMEKACQRNGCAYTAPYLFAECRSGRALLFAIADDGNVHAALVGCVEDIQGERIFRILAMCGRNMKTWLDTIVSHEKWVNHLNCKKVRFEGGEAYRRLVSEAKVVSFTYEVDF